MLRPRIIPCLLVHNKGLVKTVKFKEAKYVGDPINAVKIFNEKEVDELIVLDIDATVQKREPDYKMIENLAFECRMPLCYGGGVKTAEVAQRIFNLGVEKIAISSSAIERPQLVSEIAQQVGSQSVVVIIDAKKNKVGNYDILTHNAKKNSGKSIMDLITEFENLGAGEIVVNSIDNDGMMKGYDMELVKIIRKRLKIPLTVLGGAGSLKDIGTMIREHGIIGSAAGSLFVFKGIYKAVLISYPDNAQRSIIIDENYSQFLNNPHNNIN